MLKKLLNELYLDTLTSIERYTLHDEKLVITFNTAYSDAYIVNDMVNILDKIDKTLFNFRYLDGTLEVSPL